jgi:hypothetical protein
LPPWGTGTKTNWPTDRRSQSNLKLNLRHCTANYRPVLSSERAPYIENKESNCHSNKCNIWSLAPKGAGHQDELADSRPVSLDARRPSGTRDQFYFLLEMFFIQLRVCNFLSLSLTRGRVCNLLYNDFWVLPEQSFLGRSPAELTPIFYCLI